MGVATIVDLGANGGQPIQFTCASGTAIAKGTLMALTDPRTAAAATADNDMFAGIAASEKSATDETTTIACYQEGLFDIDSDGHAATTVGGDVVISGANTVTNYTTLDDEKGYVVGKALEIQAADVAETILVAIKGPFNG